MQHGRIDMLSTLLQSFCSPCFYRHTNLRSHHSTLITSTKLKASERAAEERLQIVNYISHSRPVQGQDFGKKAIHGFAKVTVRYTDIKASLYINPPNCDYLLKSLCVLVPKELEQGFSL